MLQRKLALLGMLAIPCDALHADAQHGCALPAGMQYTVGVAELPMTSLFPVTVLVAREERTVAAQLSQMRVEDILGSPAVASGRFPELGRLSKLRQDASVSVDSIVRRELGSSRPISDIRTATLGESLRNLTRVAGAARVIGDEGSQDDLNVRFPDIAGKFSKSEMTRQAQKTCKSSLYREFKAAAEALVAVTGANDYHEVPLRLVNAKRLPVREGDRDFGAIKRFEDKYRALIEGCTSPRVDAWISRIVGRLTIGRSVCTAMRIAPAHIATNRHCLFDEAGSPISGISAVDVHVEFQGQAGKAIPVCGVVQVPSSQLFSNINPGNDFVILRIGERDDSVGRVGLLPPEDIRAGTDQPTELELVSVWPGSGALNLSGGLDLATYTGGYCLVIKKGIENGRGCFLHQCGSLPGGSGAPAFERNAGQPQYAGKPLRVAGLHRGDASDIGSSSRCQEILPGVRSNNAATILPQEILDALR